MCDLTDVGMVFSHGPAIVAAEKSDITEKRKAIYTEILNIGGYIPIVGVIIGIARIIFAAIAFNEKYQNSLIAPLMFRAAAEIIGLGPVLLISDLIVTGILLSVRKSCTIR